MTRVLGCKDTHEWLRAKRLQIDGGQMGEASPREVLSFMIADGVGTRAAFATPISFMFSGDSEVLLVVDDWGRFGAEYADPNLLLRFVRSFGDEQELDEPIGFLMGEEDKADLVSLIRLALWSQWGCYVLSGSGRVVFRITHDGRASLRLCSADSLDPMWHEVFEFMTSESDRIVWPSDQKRTV